MTTERDPIEGDKLVTETYRELGVEKTPEHLNQTILRMASADGKQTGTRNLLFAAWMKPVAWAATIGLSLAIVLELTQVPTVAVRSDAVPAGESTLEEVVLPDADVLEKAENELRFQSGANRQAITEDEPRHSESADDFKIPGREAEGKSNAIGAPAQAPSSLLLSPVSDAEIPATPQPSARKRAADVPSDTKGMRTESDSGESCDAAARLSAESWMECIEDLRRSGAAEAADLEYEAFILEYPIDSGE